MIASGSGVHVMIAALTVGAFIVIFALTFRHLLTRSDGTRPPRHRPDR